MPYIGKQLVRGQNRKLDDISSGFNGSQTTFTLQVASQNVTVGSALQLWISLGGVIQDPLSDYTIAGNQITFTTAPASGLDFFGVIQGDVTDTNTPGDATVTTSKLSTGLTVNLADGSAATSSLQLGGTDSGLFSSAADKVNVTTGGVERLEIGDSEVVFNDPSNDVDFRVESNGNAAMLFVDGGNDRVGIGTSSPTSLLEIKGGAATTTITSSTNTANLDITNSTQTTRLGAANNDFAVTHNGSESFRIDSSGRLLVGASSAIFDNANAKVQIAADAGGTLAIGRSDTSVTAGNGIGLIRFYGNDDSGYQECARIAANADGTHANNDKPTRLEFLTTADNGSSPTEQLRINSDGDLLFKQEASSSPYPEQQLKWSNDGTTANGFFISQDSNRNGKIFHQQGLDILFGTNNTERLRIDSSGNVGIGATSAAQVLQVHKAASSASYVHITNSVSGSNSSDGMLVGLNASAAALVWNQENTEMRFATNNTERMRIDSSGRLLYGHSTSRTVYGIQSPVQIEGTNFESGSLSITCNNVSDFPILLLARSRGSSNGSNVAPTDGQVIGEVSFVPSDGTNMGAASVRLQGVADDNHAENDVPGRFVIQVVPDGSESSAEKFRLHNGGKLSVVGVYNGTTTGGSPVYVEADGDLLRYTSSLKYKTDVETIEDARADAILNCRPVWYRSKCENDIKTEGSEKSDWGWYGFIAEEVAEIEPRLVNWATKDAVTQENGLNKTVERDPADYSAEGVRYDNFVPLLVNLVKRQQAAIETLEAKVAALEAK